MKIPKRLGQRRDGAPNECSTRQVSFFHFVGRDEYSEGFKAGAREAFKRAQPLVEALREIQNWWDVSDPANIQPAHLENEMEPNESMAAYSILNAVNVLSDWLKWRGNG